MSYLFFTFILLLATLAPVFIKKDIDKPRKLIYVNRVIIVFSIIFAVSSFVTIYSNVLYDSLPVACPDGTQHPGSFDPFGHQGKCLELSSEQDRVEMINILDRIGAVGMIFSVVLIVLLATVGFIMEIVDKRSREKGAIGALWSTSFFVLLSITFLLIVALFM